MALELEEIEKRTTPLGLWRYALEYFKGFTIIKLKEPGELSLVPVKFFLLCHSIELAFKAYLRHKNYKVKQLMDFGHDLEALMDELHSKHEITLSKNFVEVVLDANQYYKTKQYEYFQSGYKILPDISNLENLARLFIRKVEYNLKEPRVTKEKENSNTS